MSERVSRLLRVAATAALLVAAFGAYHVSCAPKQAAQGFITGPGIFPSGGGGGGGGGGDITAVNTAAPLTGGVSTGAANLAFAETGCVLGDSWQFQSAGVWACDPAGTGDITGVTAGTGLTGGATSGNATLNVDDTVVQNRVSGTCAAGTSIRVVNQNGTVTCETDDDSGGDITAVTAGSGLSGGGTSGAVTVSVDTSTTQSRVTGTCAGAGNGIIAVASNGTVTCDTTGGDITAVTAGTGISGGATSGAATLDFDAVKLSKRAFIFQNDECRGGNTLQGPFQYAVSGGLNTAGAEAGHGCINTMSTSTSSTGRATTLVSGDIEFGTATGETTCYDTLVAVGTLSDGTETYVFRAGFQDTLTGDSTDGAVFRHDSSTGNWLCQNRSGGAGGTTDSTIAVSTSGYQLLTVCLNGTTNVTYAIDGTTRCTINTNMPAVGTTGVGGSIIKSAGTTARTVKVDFQRVRQTFDSDRF
jgi:hypothetical protein